MLVGHKPIHYNYSYIYLYCDWDIISLVGDKEGLSICSEASWQLWWMTSKQHRYTTDPSRLLVMVSGSVSPWSVSISGGWIELMSMNWGRSTYKLHLELIFNLSEFIHCLVLVKSCTSMISAYLGHQTMGLRSRCDRVRQRHHCRGLGSPTSSPSIGRCP